MKNSRCDFIGNLLTGKGIVREGSGKRNNKRKRIVKASSTKQLHF